MPNVSTWCKAKPDGSHPALAIYQEVGWPFVHMYFVGLMLRCEVSMVVWPQHTTTPTLKVTCMVNHAVLPGGSQTHLINSGVTGPKVTTFFCYVEWTSTVLTYPSTFRSSYLLWNASVTNEHNFADLPQTLVAMATSLEGLQIKFQTDHLQP